MKFRCYALCLLFLLFAGTACNQGKPMSDIDYSKYYSDPAEIELIKAIENGDAAAVKRLASTGVNINAVGKYENTPLRTALKIGKKEIVELLLKMGVSPNFTTPKGAVPAFVALEHDNPDFLNMLLAHGLDVNLKEEGEPIVFAAMREGKWDQFKTLMNKGVDINSKTPDNTTIVQELVALSQYDFAKVLIMRGADFTSTNNAGQTVLKILVNYQTRLCADPNHPACQKRAELLRLLRERGVQVPAGLPGMGE